MNRKLFAVAVLAGALTCGLAAAQTSVPVTPGVNLSIGGSGDGQAIYNVRQMDFDLWCQQTQRYSAERCTDRRVEDIKAFEDYRTAVERYELDYLKQQQRDQDLRARTSRDPLQNVQGKQDGLP